MVTAASVGDADQQTSATPSSDNEQSMMAESVGDANQQTSATPSSDNEQAMMAESVGDANQQTSATPSSDNQQAVVALNIDQEMKSSAAVVNVAEASCDDIVENSCDSDVFPVTSYPDLSRFVPHARVEGSLEENSRPKMYVKCSSNVGNKRVFDKKHYCLFCDKGSTNLSKHLLNTHMDASYVKEVLMLPKRSCDRKHLLEKIRNLGDFKHNCAVHSKGEGVIIPWRSPPSPVPASEYIPCPDCYAFFQETHLWRHHKECTFCTHPDRKHAFKSLKTEAELLLPSTENMSAALTDVMTTARRDNFSIIMKNDSTIVKYGEKLVQKYGHLQHLYSHIICKMREVARLLAAVREIDSSVTWIADCLCPSKFDTVVRAVKNLCGFNETSNRYNIPSLALKLGHSLKKCCAILTCAGIKKGDEDQRKSADDFLYLCDKEWTTEISSAALTTLTMSKMNQPQLLPLTEDIQQLNRFLVSEMERCSAEIRSDTSITDNWQMLAKVTLTAMIVFNRKRAGEAERLLLQEYMKRDVNPLGNKDIMDSLTEVEKILCQRMARVEMRGKRGRTVAVILTPQLLDAVDLLNAKRCQAGIPEDNQFVFAKLLSQHPLRGSECLRKFAVASGAKDPASLTSTRLRKHISTTSQILNLQECELDLLAGFLGHDLHVHRNFYRLPQDTLQLAKVSKILIAYNSGRVAEYKGKSLNEITVEGDVVDIDEEQGDSEDDEQNMENSENKEENVKISQRRHAKKQAQHSPSVAVVDSNCEYVQQVSSQPTPTTSTAQLTTRDNKNLSSTVCDSGSELEVNVSSQLKIDTSTAQSKRREKRKPPRPVVYSDSDDEEHLHSQLNVSSSTAQAKRRAKRSQSRSVINSDSEDEAHLSSQLKASTSAQRKRQADRNLSTDTDSERERQLSSHKNNPSRERRKGMHTSYLNYSSV